MTRPTVPASNQPIANKDGTVTTTWQRFFNALVGTPGAIESVSSASSPLTYNASQAGVLVIVGGTVTDVTFKRARVTISAGPIRVVPVANADVVTVSYTGSPAFSFIPS